MYYPLTLFVLCTVALEASAAASTVQDLNLDVDKVYRFSLGVNTTYTITSQQELFNGTSYVVLHIHTQQYNVTLSNTELWQPNSSVFGSDVGLIADVLNGKINWVNSNQPHWYLNSSIEYNVTALIMISTHGIHDPIVGGCSLEFPLDQDPNIHLDLPSLYTTDIKFQFAKSPNESSNVCESKELAQKISYEISAVYLDPGNKNEEYFLEAMTNFLQQHKVSDSYKTKLIMMYSSDVPSLHVTSYPGTAVIYSVTAVYRYNNVDYRAMYVPVTTYACNIEGDDRLACPELENIPITLFVTILGAYGIVMCFFGHELFLAAIWYFPMLLFAMISYSMLAGLTSMVWAATLPISLLIGAVVGCAWLLLWKWKPIPMLIVVPHGLMLGIVVGSTILNITPLGNVGALSTFTPYILILLTFAVVPVLLLIAVAKWLSYISCAVVGSFMALVALDLYLPTNFSEIAALTLKKLIIPGFTQNITPLVFYPTDVTLIVMWVLLSAVGVACQWWRCRSLPSFPTNRTVQSESSALNINEDRMVLVDPN